MRFEFRKNGTEVHMRMEKRRISVSEDEVLMQFGYAAGNTQQ
jgi:hypothetical protein